MKRIVLSTVLLLAAVGCGGGENGIPDINRSGNAAPERSEVKPTGPSARDKREARELADEARGASLNYNNTRAEELLKRAVELDPEYGLAHAWLGRVLVQLGRYTEAYDHHMLAARYADEPEIAEEQHYFAAGARVESARKAETDGEYKLAEEFLNDAHKLVPETMETLFLLGRVQYARGAHAEARETYELASDMAVGDMRRDALYWVAQCDFGLEDYESAQRVFSTIINEGYTARDVFGYRAYCRFKLDDAQGALEDFRQAQEYATSPDRRQEYADAEVELMRAMQRDD